MNPFLALLPDPVPDFPAWAEKYYRFPSGDRSEGRYRIERTPYVRDILYHLSPLSSAQKVVCMKPTQVGLTTVSNIVLSALAHLYPAHCAMVFPTNGMAEKHVKTKLQRAWDAMPDVAACIGEPIKKAGSTLLFRELRGGSLTFAGAGSAEIQRSVSIQYLLMTDVDHADFKVLGEGDVIKVLERRTDSFGGVARRKKIFIESTPLERGSSVIEAEYLASSQGLFQVPCPHCARIQYLDFGGKDCEYGFKFKQSKSGAVKEAFFICKFCGAVIQENRKYDMMQNGVYIHAFPDNPIKGFRLNAFYSPVGFVGWKQIAEEWLASYKNAKMLQVFKNTRLAETFTQPGSKDLEWASLKKSAENFPLYQVPDSADCVAFGVDVHDNRLDVAIMAIRIDGEAWVIGWLSLWGDPASGDSLRELDGLLQREFISHSGGRSYRCKSCAIDTKGHRTDAIKDYCRSRYPIVIGIYGSTQRTAPLLGAPRDVDLFYGGKRIEGGFRSWPVGTYEAKSMVFEGLESKRLHLSQYLQEEFFKQLTAEQLKAVVNRQGVTTMQWVVTRPGGDNHALDACGYCLAGVSRITSVEKIKADRVANAPIIRPPQPAPPPVMAKVNQQQKQKQKPAPAPKSKVRLW